MMSSIEDTLNKLIDEFIPVLNKALPQLITAWGLDPLEKVTSGSDKLGKIKLRICKAKVKASYKIEDLTGLSSMQITSLRIDDIVSDSDPTNIIADFSVSVVVNDPLSAKVSGKVKASCRGIKESVGISGKVGANGVSGRGRGTLTASIDSEKSCIDDFDINKLSLRYKNVDVNNRKLGPFNRYFDELLDAVDDLFKGYITGELAVIVKQVLNELADDEIPFCISS